MSIAMLIGSKCTRRRYRHLKIVMDDVRTLIEGGVNRKAAEMLRSLGREPEPNRLHCVDLVLWGLEQSDEEVSGAVIETLRAMTAWLPQRIMNFLELMPGQEYEPPGWEAARTPLDLAILVFNDLERRMFLKFPWYGSLDA